MSHDRFKSLVRERASIGTPPPCSPGMLLIEVEPTGVLPDYQATQQHVTDCCLFMYLAKSGHEQEGDLKARVKTRFM